jgi:hypothetical protein
LEREQSGENERSGRHVFTVRRRKLRSGCATVGLKASDREHSRAIPSTVDPSECLCPQQLT